MMKIKIKRIEIINFMDMDVGSFYNLMTHV